MEFEKQKPITDEYRRGWDRIFGWSLVSNPGGMTHAEYAESLQNGGTMIYPNGCPILSESEPEPREGPQRDDL